LVLLRRDGVREYDARIGFRLSASLTLLLERTTYSEGQKMGTTVTFAKIQSYLDAIADAANNDIARSPHDRFWSVSYAQFTTGNVPLRPRDPVTPIINRANPTQSSFYQVLLGPFQGFNQMPDGGPVVNGTVFAVGPAQVQGSTILADMLDWLTHGYPEFGN
jgi:hypothetical protein